MSTLHFSCSFSIRAKEAEDSWGNLLRTVRKWISKRPCPDRDDAFWDAWFYKGGEWRASKDPKIRVLTRGCYGNKVHQDSDCWAAEFEHPCDEYPGCRIWRTHVGVEQYGLGQFHFNLQILYDIRAGYIGLPPKVPLPSSPGLVTRLLTSDFWQCTVGTKQLSVKPQVLRVGEGKLFERILSSRERTCPVVLISQIYPDLGYTIEPMELSRLLAGTSIVFQSENSEVDQELDYILGRRFSCWNGMIRVYAPNLDFERKGDYKRHRFILRKDIEAWGIDKAKEIIVTGLARRSQSPRGILTPRDVERIFRKRHLAELRAQQNAQPNDEWIRALEEDNDELNQANAQLWIDNAALQERIDALSDEHQRLKSDKRLRKKLSVNWFILHKRFSRSRQCSYSDIVSR